MNTYSGCLCHNMLFTARLCHQIMTISNVGIYSQMSTWPEWKESGQGFGLFKSPACTVALCCSLCTGNIFLGRLLLRHYLQNVVAAYWRTAQRFEATEALMYESTFCVLETNTRMLIFLSRRSLQIKSACTVNGFSSNPSDVIHSRPSLFVPITLIISELSAVAKLEAADSALLCTAAEALSWLLNYHLWWSGWLKAHPERQECVWEAPVGYRCHADVTFPRMCFLCSAHEKNM